MNLSRRSLLLSGSAALAAASLPARAQHMHVFAPRPGTWRRFEVKTTLTLPEGQGAAQAWIPLPGFHDARWMKPGDTSFTTRAGTARRVEDPGSGAQMVHVVWPAGTAAPAIEVTSTFATQDRQAVPGGPVADLTPAERARYVAPTALLPTDGLVRETAGRIVAGAVSDQEKAHRLYHWVVANTFRDPKTRGCGVGDIAAMLRTGQLSGKCADLNALFVGLARAAGLPARDLYGLRVAPSAFGYKSLGANSATVTKAQHCRAEVFLSGLGWVAMDPADVRKVMLEEGAGNLGADDPRVVAARATLLGGWEGNWLAYNEAHDVALPGSAGEKLGFLMYPQAETAAGRLDCLDPDSFRYTITARALEA